MRVIRKRAPDELPLRRRDGARKRTLTWTQLMVWGGLLFVSLMAWLNSPDGLLNGVILISQIAFVSLAAWRILLVIVAVTRPETPIALAAGDDLPRYTVLAALYDEADIAPQLIRRLSCMDYPADRLEGFLLLEAHDTETHAAVASQELPSWLSILIVPPGQPQTKPRALNYGLARASGEFVTIYDAEDDPDPLQLREAVARFEQPGMADVACLQAPLFIRSNPRTPQASRFLDRQFAVEYAALFGVTLPAMARLGLPFPLGGTSNHFRATALGAVGGWDDWNVTEDADLGFALWRRGWRLGILSRPTYESPPGPLEHWLPQRVRWLKGYMQTWGVHTRQPLGLGAWGLWSLIVTLGAGLASAASHAITLAWALAWVLVSLMAGISPALPLFAMGVLILSTAAAWLLCQIGARRAHTPYTAVDMILAPVYWSLLTLAFLHAAWRLVREPFVWDKTAHQRDEEAVSPQPVVADAGRQPA